MKSMSSSKKQTTMWKDLICRFIFRNIKIVLSYTELRYLYILNNKCFILTFHFSENWLFINVKVKTQ